MNSISKNGGEVYGFAVDVSKRSDILEAIRMMRKAGIGDVSILINTAEVGGGARRALLEHDDKDIRKIFDVNVMSQFWVMIYVLNFSTRLLPSCPELKSNLSSFVVSCRRPSNRSYHRCCSTKKDTLFRSVACVGYTAWLIECLSARPSLLPEHRHDARCEGKGYAEEEGASTMISSTVTGRHCTLSVVWQLRSVPGPHCVRSCIATLLTL
ncbi:unnamed protein product [Trichogramma brassicae]|uniref:Uncharacterized protein n=1 Tax=Trichogramma brassicae TaxID=86971 RepID=A0A6H5I313_9HYME|nr:unnamed protein product [Trichogramma brassicae]